MVTCNGKKSEAGKNSLHNDKIKKTLTNSFVSIHDLSQNKIKTINMQQTKTGKTRLSSRQLQ